jgi:prepilin-type N-terminal cleavage/methylation domain-containing protein
MSQTRRGFTLIELLIVVVIIGILAAFAVPKFQSTKGKAFAGSLKSDLRNLATAQEAYFYEKNIYTSNLSNLNFNGSPGVIFTFGAATGGGWSAVATHPQAAPIQCAIFVGSAPPLAPATTEGIIKCQ